MISDKSINIKKLSIDYLPSLALPRSAHAPTPRGKKILDAPLYMMLLNSIQLHHLQFYTCILLLFSQYMQIFTSISSIVDLCIIPSVSLIYRANL